MHLRAALSMRRLVVVADEVSEVVGNSYIYSKINTISMLEYMYREPRKAVPFIGLGNLSNYACIPLYNIHIYDSALDGGFCWRNNGNLK